MKAPLITFHSVAFHYPSNHQGVFSNLNLTIPRGEVTAILGPNGAGKTTLLHLTLGWRTPSRGKILLNGRPLDTYSRQELGRWIGLVPQNEHVAFEYSLLEYVLLGRTPYLHALEMPGEKDCSLAFQSLEQVRLADQANRSVLKLSGGERQLVLLARALVQQPQLILMDEPTSHLDLGNKKRLLEIIHMLQMEGISIVLTTHEPDFAAAAASNLVLMRSGEIQDGGTLKDVFTTEKISRLYQSPVKVVDLDGQKLVAWISNP